MLGKCGQMWETCGKKLGNVGYFGKCGKCGEFLQCGKMWGILMWEKIIRMWKNDVGNVGNCGKCGECGEYVGNCGKMWGNLVPETGGDVGKWYSMILEFFKMPKFSKNVSISLDIKQFQNCEKTGVQDDSSGPLQLIFSTQSGRGNNVSLNGAPLVRGFFNCKLLVQITHCAELLI